MLRSLIVEKYLLAKQKGLIRMKLRSAFPLLNNTRKSVIYGVWFEILHSSIDLFRVHFLFTKTTYSDAISVWHDLMEISMNWCCRVAEVTCNRFKTLSIYFSLVMNYMFFSFILPFIALCTIKWSCSDWYL